MAPETTNSQLNEAMEQIFYSELAGHLFTARGTDVPHRIVNTQFAEDASQTLDCSQEITTNSSESSTHPSLPTFSLEEATSRIHTLRSHGIMLLDGCFPTREAACVPAIAPLNLASLRLQPPKFALCHGPTMRRATAQEKLACLQLMLLVAYDWWDMLSDMLDDIYKALAIFPCYNFDEGVQAFGLACSRGHENSLQCLLQFLVPTVVDDSPRVLQIPRFGQLGEYNFLQCMARLGLERPRYAGNSKLDFPPRILQQLQRNFANTKLFTVSETEGVNPLALALRYGDATLSELFITWMGPSDISKLVLPGTGVSILQAACDGNLVALAKYFVEAGAPVGHCSSITNDTYLHHACGSPKRSDAKAVDLVRYLHELGEDLFARNYINGCTPLHIAAAHGKRSVVRYILAQARSRQQRHPKDDSGKTPLMLAKNTRVMQEFLPWRPSLYGDTIKDVCEQYYALKHDVYQERGAVRLVPIYLSVHQLLYEQASSVIFQKNDHVPLQWIHLPANNIEWCDDLLLRWYLDGNGEHSMQDLEMARQAFNQQHVSHTRQGRFIRPGVHCNQLSKHVFFVAVPYIDFETSSNLEQMQKVLQTSTLYDSNAARSTARDEYLYATYADDPGFHPRRTLDQYVYYNMDTSERDADQVVQRYQKSQANRSNDTLDGHARRKHELYDHTLSGSMGDASETMIMVDQLWIWILGDRLIVTCCAQRWNALEPPDRHAIRDRFKDTLSDGLELRGATASDFAVQFMATCCGTFDRHARETPRLQFMSMFEQSLGIIGAKDSDLMRKFSAAYTALKSNKGTSRETFVKALNDLTTETDLLTELKDIRDELHIMETILVDQQRVARSLLNLQTKAVRNHRTSLFGSIKVETARPEDHEEVFEPINTIIDQGLQDIAQLDAQATRLSGSLSELLQLKQAHYNAFQLKASHDLALDAVKQGRAVLVFTIVTIVFSPLSFVAAFFTMNLTVFPEELSLSYVSRYVFGLGLAVAIPCIVLALSLSSWSSSWKRIQDVFDGPTFGAGDFDPFDKNEGLKLPGSTQNIDQLSNRSPEIPQIN